MKEIVKKGRTVEEAIEEALSELGVSRNEVSIEVVAEGNKGLFGILGGKEAEVRVAVKEVSKEEKAKNFLSEVFNKLGISPEMEVSCTEEKINIDISGSDVGVLIGRRGETLTAVQYLTGIAANKGSDEYIRVFVDVENYRKKREETLIKLANRTAEKVVKYRRSMTLEPMSSYERRIIHSALQTNTQVNTYSSGEEPGRRIVVVYGRGNK